MKHIISMAFLFLAVAMLGGETVFKEGFSGYPDNPPRKVFSDACNLAELPPAQWHLNFKSKDGKRASVYNGGIFKLPYSGNLENYEFSFRFQFPDESKKNLSLELFADGDASKNQKHVKYTVNLNEKGLSFNAAPAVGSPQNQPLTANDLDLPSFLAKGWNSFKAVSRGKNMEIYLDVAGQFVRFGIFETHGTPLRGFNFSSDGVVNIDDIEVDSIDSASISSGMRKGDDAITSNGSSVCDIPVAGGAKYAGAEVRLGYIKGGLNIRLTDENGQTRVISGKIIPENATRVVTQNIYELDDKTGKYADKPTQKKVSENYSLPDAGIRYTGLSGNPKDAVLYYFRPQIKGMDSDMQTFYASEWKSFKGASERFIKYEFILDDPQRPEVWIDGKYCGSPELSAKLAKVSFELPPGASMKKLSRDIAAADPLFVPLDLSGQNNVPGVFADAELNLKSKLSGSGCIIENIPFKLLSGSENLDLGATGNIWGDSWGGERYWHRNPYNAARENIICPVPNLQYTRAWILCAAEDVKDIEPVVTARLTRYGGLVGPQIADTTIRLPRSGENPPDGVRKVGSLRMAGKEIPLYLVEIPLNSGKIQDLIVQSVRSGVLKDNNQSRIPRLDFELFGAKETGNHFYVNRDSFPSYSAKSPVHVFGATLEKSPVEFSVLPASFGNSYLPGERMEMDVSMHSAIKGDYVLSWIFRDVRGNEIGREKKNVSFGGKGGEEKFSVPLKQKSLGWYGVDFTLNDKNGKKIIEHKAAFALLSGKERKAGYDSQYFSWSHNLGVHGDTPYIDLVKSLYSKAGIGQITTIGSEAEFMPAKITAASVPWLSSIRAKMTRAAGGKFAGYDSPEFEAEFKKEVDSYLIRYPHVKSALIFHEGRGGRYPVELFGMQLAPDEDADKREKGTYQEALSIASLYRKYYPQLKLEVGNCGDSTGVMAALFRNKFKNADIDFIGEEWGGGITKLAEDGLSRNFWSLRELARKFGYSAPVIANYEWKYRIVEHEGGYRNAVWSSRDWLVAHAWRSPRIPFTCITDAGNYYHYTVWGSGLLSRYPEAYPHPAYAAASTMTQVLDCATLEKQLDTGSPTVYALEFKRGAEFVYVLWTARGELDAVLSPEKDGEFLRTDVFGAESNIRSKDKTLAVTISEEPFYLSGSAKLSGASLGKRRFPAEAVPSDKKVSVADNMNDIGKWKLVSGTDEMLDIPIVTEPRNNRFRKPGKFEMRQVQDDEKGACIELELKKDSLNTPLVQEYCTLALKEGVTVPGTPDTIGVWCKGNSGWGKLFFRFEDAEGECWISGPSGGFGCDVYDLESFASVNFDGWHFMRFPINSKSHMRRNGVMPETLYWRRDGKGNGRVDYPIKLTGFGVSTSLRAINLVDDFEVSPTLRFSGFSAY